MRALVTGASGFLGSHLVRRLTDEGQEVAVLARRGSSRRRLVGLPVEEFVGDLGDADTLRTAAAGRQLVVHCAARCSAVGSYEEFRSANTVGTQQLLEAVRSSSRCLRRLVHISTTDVYGYPRRPGDESAPTRRVGLPYNETKIDAERSMRQGIEEGLPIVVLRPATLYGPGSPAVVTSIVRALEAGAMAHINGGREHAGLIHVSDVVDAVVAAVSSDRAVGRTYNLCNEEHVTWRRFTDTLADIIGAPRPRLSLPLRAALGAARLAEFFASASAREPWLTRHAVLLLGRSQAFPASRVVTELGVRPRVRFEEGILETLPEAFDPEKARPE